MFKKDEKTYLEVGEELLEEVRLLILSGSPNLRSRMLSFSGFETDWSIDKWRLFRSHTIILKIHAINFDDIEFQNIKMIIEDHLMEVLKKFPFAGYKIRMVFEKENNEYS